MKGKELNCEFRKGEVEEITTLNCSNCGEEIESCDDCFYEFDVCEKVFCNGYSHLCKECYIKRKKISNEYNKMERKEEGIE